MDLTRGQKLLVLAGLAAALLGLLVLSFSRTARPPAPIAYSAATSAQQPPSPPQYVAVHVVGAVAAPGLYWLSTGARAAEAIAAAGGFAPQADQASVNLAAPLQDGQQISVAALSAPAAPAPAAVASPPPAPQATSPAPSPVPAAPSPPPTVAVVSLNQATKPQLEALPGIGPELAGRILYYRYEHGPFKTVDDLLAVEGIGRNRLDALRPFLRP